ncbi:hypothetical protein B0H17DRAFT_1334057 [Mycena rosella]|uniref:Nuclear condensin complex subunit 3 C-terminal domain-containing protein n=1 Tax=Mycena rosella TaxID=1033263 RepID=A0AAD7D4W0_MYCRO|nr:hypothetical protein B0H17DRAFT_1334057 [Mycena rosella]
MLLTTDEKQQKIRTTLAAFLQMFNIRTVSKGPDGKIQHGKVASDALKSVFETCPDMFEDLYFGDAFFAQLSPEKIFLARVFVDHCVGRDHEDTGTGEQRIEGASIPVVTSLAFWIQDGYNSLTIADDKTLGVEQDEERKKELILTEMLKLVVMLDYGDEIGRRKMFALVRNMLGRPTLPLDLLPGCLDVLRKLSLNERDLIRVVAEIVQDLRELDKDDDFNRAYQSQDAINSDGDASTTFGSKETGAFIPIFQELSTLCHNREEEQAAVNFAQITDIWVDWTDPSQVQPPNGRPGDTGGVGDPLEHFEMANDIIRELLKGEMPRDDRKVFVQMLGKLSIPDEVDVDKTRTLKLLMHTLNLRRPLYDTIANNAFQKFAANISKKFEKQLEDFDEAEYRKLEELKDLFDFLDEIIPEDDVVVSTDTTKKGKRRRSYSIGNTADGDTLPFLKAKLQTKKRRLATSDAEEPDFENTAATPTPTRTLPTRPPAWHPEVIIISSDSEDEPHEATSVARKLRPQVVSRTRKVKQEAILDVDIDSPLGEGTSIEVPYDSLFDDSDEEDEVNDLLEL